MENGMNHRLVCVIVSSDPLRANPWLLEIVSHDCHQERASLEDSKTKETLKIVNEMHVHT